MTVTVHRGTHQIGGCATEIKTDQHRIIIDVGSELDGNVPLCIPGVTCGPSQCDAVLMTHYHGDHIGQLSAVNRDIPMYIGALSLEILKRQNRRQPIALDDDIDRIVPYVTAKPLVFGDIRVTPFLVDHSAFDAHIFLIEADGKRLLHTGDFRSHGFRGKGLLTVLKRYVGKVDALICEGTTLSRSDRTAMTERELSLCAAAWMKTNPYTFVVCASTNIDRLAAFCSAVPRGRYCLCDGYQETILEAVREHSGRHSLLYRFEKMVTYGPNLNKKMRSHGFCMFVRPGNRLSTQLMEQYKEQDPLVIYSMWSGYLQGERMKRALSGYRVKMLHTSGHADAETIRTVMDVVQPNVIIPIHTDAPERFPQYMGTVLSVQDGEEIRL